MDALIERYRAGEHERVWSELTAAGSAVRVEPLRAMAAAVARETMRRARANIEILIPRLHELGYQFGLEAVDRSYAGGLAMDERDGGRDPFQPPLSERGALLAELEALVGPLPLSLMAWYDIVGAVNLMGAHPDWRGSDKAVMVRPDPLVIDPLDAVVE